MDNKYIDRLRALWRSIARRDGEEEDVMIDRERIVVLVIAIILAFCLWLIVNLNRDFTLDVQIPVELGNISTEQSLAEELPREVTASVSGNGWNLINLYNNPPRIYLDVTGEEVNLFEQVRRQMANSPNVTVQTVEPLYLQVQLEPRQEKKVPVRANVSIDFADQYDFVGDPQLTPDSITVRGAQSHIENINSWPTDSLALRNIRENFSRELGLRQAGSLVTLSRASVTISGIVEQYTEGEVSVPIQTRNFPVGDMVTFSPSAVRIKYRVPLSEYRSLDDGQTFTAYVAYSQIQQDTTGFIAPQVEKLSDESNISIRNVRPGDVAYFTIIGN